MKKTFLVGVVVTMSIILLAMYATTLELPRSANAEDSGTVSPPADDDAVMWLKVTRDGTIVPLSIEGRELKPCTLATPGLPDDDDVCKGFSKGYHMLSVDTISIFRADGSPDCYIYYDAQGNPHEVCW